MLYACSSKSEKPSQLRIGQFIFTEQHIQVNFNQDDSLILKKTLNYGELTTYEKLNSGSYQVDVLLNNKVLLQKKIGIGKDGIYTLILNGIPKKDQKTNEKTTNMKLHEIVEGEEAIYPNGNLPQMRILNDEFEAGKNEGKIRWIHLAAGMEEVSAVAKMINSESTDLSALTYPKMGKDYSVNPKIYEVIWKLKGSEVEVSRLKLDVKSNYLYTCFLIGKKGNYLDSLKVVVGETPKKGF